MPSQHALSSSHIRSQVSRLTLSQRRRRETPPDRLRRWLRVKRFDSFTSAPGLVRIAWIAFLIACGGPSTAARAEDVPTAEAIRSAVAKSLPLLEQGAKGSLEQRKQCFTCHNQGLPIQALTVARLRGFKIDEEHLQTQLEFTANFLGRNKANYLLGKGQGGQIDTAGYALWALDNGGWKPDETTAAVAEYFLLFQKEDEHWAPQSRRPPTEQSPFTSSFLALRALQVYGTQEQHERIEARTTRVRKWLLETTPTDTEDRVFRLRALHLLGVPPDVIQQATQELQKTQREDGGWNQLQDLPSDPYATGSTLVALHLAGAVPVSDPTFRKGLGYLISTQQADGSWHVTTRSKPFQTYFESGYPHGKDQFISISAAGWSTTALALSLPPK